MDTWILILFIIVLISITITLIIRKYVLFITQVSSHSMLPTLESDERLVTFHVPENEYFFLGDNRAGFNDSRHWEQPTIPAKDLIGLKKR